MWDYISDVGKAIRKYRTGVGATLSCLALAFILGCAPEDDNRRVSEIMGEGLGTGRRVHVRYMYEGQDFPSGPGAPRHGHPGHHDKGGRRPKYRR